MSQSYIMLVPVGLIICVYCSSYINFFGVTAYELMVVFSLEMPTESEKAVMEQFFQKDSMVRQSQVHMHPFTHILHVYMEKTLHSVSVVCVFI